MIETFYRRPIDSAQESIIERHRDGIRREKQNILISQIVAMFPLILPLYLGGFNFEIYSLEWGLAVAIFFVFMFFGTWSMRRKLENDERLKFFLTHGFIISNNGLDDNCLYGILEDSVSEEEKVSWMRSLLIFSIRVLMMIPIMIVAHFTFIHRDALIHFIKQVFSLL